MLFQKTICGFLALLFLCGSFFALEKIILAQIQEEGTENQSGAVLISEIMTGAEQAGDEFIELYNPNGYAVDLSGWSLKKKTKAGVTEYGLLSDAGTKVDPVTGLRNDTGAGLRIAPRGYFLIAPRYVCGALENEKCYTGGAEADNFYSVKGLFLADDNSIALYDGGKNLMDKVGWGAAGDFSGSVFAGNIPAGKSLARKIVAGEMQSTGDNSRDFFLQDAPDPQNCMSLPAADAGTVSGENVALPDSDSGSADVQGEVAYENAVEDSSVESPQSPAGADPLDHTSGGASDELAAAEKKIVVSELLLNPAGEDAKLEFVEIYNAGQNEADIGGWSLEDLAGKAGKYVFPAATKIESGQYRALYSSLTKLSLNNDGDGAALKDETGKLIDRTPLSDAAKEDVSFALKDGRWLWTIALTPGAENIIKEKAAAEKPAQSQPATAQPESEIKNVAGETAPPETESASVAAEEGEDESVESEAYDFSDGVIINEIFPDPAGKDNQAGGYEWVELFNENDRGVDLKGWCLDDVLEKGSKAYCFADDRIIAARSYLSVSSSETKIAFNNSEEDVNLLWPDKRIVDSVSYQKAKEGYSYSLGVGGVWSWTKETTPAAANAKTAVKAPAAPAAPAKRSSTISSGGKQETRAQVSGSEAAAPDAPAEENFIAVSIAEAKKLPIGSPVSLSGLVSAARGTLGENILYIMEKDTGEGIQVFGGEELSSLLLGDEVKISGSMSEVGGEKRLMAKAIPAEKISSNNLLESFALDPANLQDSLGGLAAVQGEAGSVADGRTLFLKISGTELKIYAEPETSISFSEVRAGDRLEVTGIFSRTSLGYRLLPRFKSDIRFLKKADGGIIGKSDETSGGGDFALFLQVAFLAALLNVILKRKFIGAGGKAKAAKGAAADEERAEGEAA